MISQAHRIFTSPINDRIEQIEKNAHEEFFEVGFGLLDLFRDFGVYDAPALARNDKSRSRQHLGQRDQGG